MNIEFKILKEWYEGDDYFCCKEYFPSGNIRWFKNEDLHRINGPATIATNSTFGKRLEWFYEDEYHRINGPAYIDDCNNIFWFCHGKNVQNQLHLILTLLKQKNNENC